MKTEINRLRDLNDELDEECTNRQLEIYKLQEKISDLKFRIRDMQSMIDGAYEVVKLYGYENREKSPACLKWAVYWCEKASKYGADTWL